MKYVRRTLFSSLLIAGTLCYGYYFASKTRIIPQEVEAQILSSLVKQDKIIHLSLKKGTLSSPSIIAAPNGYLLSTILKKRERYAVKNWKSREKIEKYYITLTSLNDELETRTSSQLIQLKDHAGIPLFNLIQANLLSFQNTNWLFYIDQPMPNRYNYYASPIYEYENKFILGPAKLLSCNQYGDANARWVPMIMDNEMFLFSNTQAISCLSVDFSSGKCRPISEFMLDQSWDFGNISCYCPTIQTTQGTIGFFHSTLETPHFLDRAKRSTINLIGAWSPSLQETFHIGTISQGPITSSRLYSNLSNQKKLVEPYGITEKNGHIIVSSLVGRQKIHVMKIKTKDLFAHMKNLSSETNHQEA